MSRFSALLDSCVLTPVSLADTLLRLASAGFYRPVFSEKILREMAEALNKDIYKNSFGSVPGNKRFNAISVNFPDALVTDYEQLINSVSLPDFNDRHVLAAAIVGRADIIVTNNLKDFPEEETLKYDIEVKTADEFLLDLLDLDSRGCINCLVKQAQSLKNPPMTVINILDSLEKAEAKEFAVKVRSQLWKIQ